MAVSIQGRALASATIATDTTTAAQPFAVSPQTKAIAAVMTIASRTDGTYTLKIQHSHDGGTTWKDLVASSGITADGTTYLEYAEAVDGACFGLVRVAVLSASTTTGATVGAVIFHD